MSRPRFEQFYAVRRFSWLGGIAFSPDASEISYSHDGSGQFNLWRQPVAGGWPTQLTTFEEDAARWHTWTPQGFVLGVDHHGNEQWQVNRLPAAGGWPEDLTGRTDVQFVSGPGALAADGERMLVSGNAVRPEDVSLYVLHIKDGELQPVLEEEGKWYPGPWHPDGRQAITTRVHGNTDVELHLVDVQTGERRHLTPHEGELMTSPVGFSADGESLYVRTDLGHDHMWLGRMPLGGGPIQEIWKGPWEVEHAGLDAAGRTLAYSINEDGWSRTCVLDLDTGRTRELDGFPGGWPLHFNLSADGSRLAIVDTKPTSPFEVYVAEIASGAVTRLTHSFLGGIPEADLVEPELVRYRTFDDRHVPAWLYRPRGAPGKVPVLVEIHGGPEAQERPLYSPFTQYLLSRGLAVLKPNIRGSTGYGRSYQRLIHRDWGGGELKDIQAGAEYLRAQPWADSSRIAVYGGSFGGFATLSAMTRLPEYWTCGIDVVGPSNLVSFAKAVPPFWRSSMKKLVGDPEEDAEMLTERSPITYVENIRAPLLVLQGANDPRVVRPESDQMVERLRALGREVEYHVFDDEGHGFTKRVNLMRAHRLMIDFLFKHLGVEA